jgi:hypothetical protein
MGDVLPAQSFRIAVRSWSAQHNRFFARSCSAPQESLAMEVKILANGSRAKILNFENDIQKLRKFSHSEGCKDLYLLIVGRKSELKGKDLLLDNKRIYLDKAPSIIADIGATAWGSIAIKVSP